MDALRERRAHVRRAERDDVADAAAVDAAGRLVAGAACHEPAHRVPDERDRSTCTGHAATPASSSSASERAVVGDVAAGVVADVERRCSRGRAPAARRSPPSRRAATRARSPSARAGSTTSRGVAPGTRGERVALGATRARRRAAPSAPAASEPSASSASP